ncbi:nitroreductase [Dictyobacter alpinus]|uniref:Nitroreductase n=1 Tax=Dictyobacter alpinus TaxID=2014873 RepID=A0A402BHH9_9CHLR|nr:nitroreductase family deazaflavin-dependent oxidoreductase [Dictyobacter alpinus]GCE30779.1 nitroreductase [Dictyobacter alpinus]
MVSEQKTSGSAGIPRTLARLFMNGHVSLYRLTGGAIGGKLIGLPALILTTIGRKSGEPRVTPLTYIPDGERYILIASNGGSDRAPTWWLNLVANPEAKIEVGRQKISVRAKTADAQERAILWPRIVAQAPNYGGYQKKTDREIPVIILTRVA